MGIITPIGSNMKEYTNSLKQLKKGIKELTNYPSKQVRYGGEIDINLNNEKLQQMIISAMEEALYDAGMEPNQLKDRQEIGLVFGTSLGNTYSKYEYVKEMNHSMNSTLMNREFENSLLAWSTRYLVKKYQMSGPSFTVTNTCVSGMNAIHIACQLLQSGIVEYCIVGAADLLSNFIVSGMGGLRALSKKKKLEPFAADRDGIILGESAGFIVLTNQNHAGQNYYGKIAASCITNDAKHLTSPDEEAKGLILAIQKSFEMANWQEKDIDCIFCCGTGTKYNDSSQAVAIRHIFQSQFNRVFLSSIKPYIGHTLGASGVVEMISAFLMMKEGYVVPIGQPYHVDPECENLPLLFHEKKSDLKRAILLSAGFSGVNGSLLIERRNLAHEVH